MVKLFSSDWWRDVAARAGRQAVQSALPLLALAAAGNLTGVDPLGVALGIALAVALTVIGAVMGASFGPDAPVWQQAVERALKGALGAVLAILPVDGRGLLDLDFKTAGIAALGAAGLALAAMVTNPPKTVEVDYGGTGLSIPADDPRPPDAGAGELRLILCVAGGVLVAAVVLTVVNLLLDHPIGLG